MLSNVSGWTLLFVALPALQAQVITTIAGSDFLFPHTPIRGLDAPLGQLGSTSVDADGNAYVLDRANCIVLRITPEGVATVIGGNGICGFTGDGGLAVNAAISSPQSGALDGAGNYFVRESFRIRKIGVDGIIRTIAGNGTYNPTAPAGEGGPAISAGISPSGALAASAAGELYIVEPQAHRIRKIDLSGIITTVAGTSARGFSGDGGPASAAQLANPTAAVVDAAGNLYLADSGNSRIRKVAPDGIITTVAPVQADSLAVDAGGELYYSNGSRPTVFRLNANGSGTAIAGGATVGFSGDGGPATQARLQVFLSYAFDRQGNLFLSDILNFRVRKVDAQGIISTIAGTGASRYGGEGTPALSTPLTNPTGIALDSAGNVYVAENGGHRVRKLSGGLLTTFAGTGFVNLTGSNGDGGPAAAAAVQGPQGLAFDPAGNLYIAQTGRVRKVAPDGSITSMAIPPTAFEPIGLAADGQGRIYAADPTNNRIYRYDADGKLNVIAGTGARAVAADGGAALGATLNAPTGIAVDAAGSVFFTETNTIRKIGVDGNLSTTAAFPQPSFLSGLAFDSAGALYIADSAFIRKIAPDGSASIIAGSRLPAPGADPGDGKRATEANLFAPRAVVVDAAGNVYFTETGTGRVRAILSAAPAFSVAPRSLVFRAASAGAPADAQNLIVTGSITGLEFTVAVDTKGTGNWLSVKPGAAVTPRLIEVIADPASLQPGTYTATITIRAAHALPAVTEAAVSFTVSNPLPPKLSLDRANFSFSFPEFGAARTETLNVANSGSGSLSFTAVIAGEGFSIDRPSGAALAGSPAVLTVTASPQGRRPGSYSGSLTISAAGETRRIPLTMSVSSNPRSIILSQTGLSFLAVEGGGVVPQQSFAVVNTGSAAAGFTVSANTLAGGDWIVTSASAASAAPGQPAPMVSVRVNPAGLKAGIYYGRVTVTAPEAANSPQYATIFLEVLPPGSDPGGLVQPAELIFTTQVGATSPGSQELLVYNLSGDAKWYQTSQTADRGALLPVQVVPERGTVAPSAPARIVVQPLTQLANTTAGTHTQALTFQFSDGRVRTAKITHIVAPRPAAASAGFNSKDLVSKGADGCAPTELVPALSSMGPAFSVSAGWPVGLDLEVRDDCGAPLTTGHVSVGFSNGDPVVSLRPVGSGRWQGTWQTGGGAGVTLTLNAIDSARQLRGQRQIGGEFRGAYEPPVFERAGVVSAAAPQSFVPIAPGGIITIYGAQLADGVAQAPSVPLPFELGTTRVLIAGRLAPLLFVSAGQINALAPFGMNPNTAQMILVQRGLTYSQPVNVDVGSAQPGIFLDGGRPIAFAYRGSEAGFAITSQAPAAPGDVVLVYAAGLGVTDREVEDGAGGPAAPVAVTANAATASVGGVVAKVLFSGLVPGFVGLYQVNLEIPQGAPRGDSVPLTLTVAGQSSPTAMLSIR